MYLSLIIDVTCIKKTFKKLFRNQATYSDEQVQIYIMFI
jgi:hypothetical protein